jgi:anti-sigma B factor antagonist
MSLANPTRATAPGSRRCPNTATGEEQFAIAVDAVQHVIYLRGELDIASAATLREAAAVLPPNGTEAITLDFAEITFLDASGLGALVQIRAAMAASDRRLVLRNVSARTARVFRAGGLEMPL